VSERLPRLTARDIIRVLERHGFALSRTSGSRVTVPVHAGKTLHPKVLTSILRDMEITADELKKELQR
jgi:predicted RNA binding protein YcfA (HicA-like mRNA interferase family)